MPYIQIYMVILWSNIEYALQKASQNDQKARIFEYTVREKAVNSNLRGRSCRSFEFTDIQY
jgi:hypothetical protein